VNFRVSNKEGPYQFRDPSSGNYYKVVEPEGYFNQVISDSFGIRDYPFQTDLTVSDVNSFSNEIIRVAPF
jgi:hypothetical protein